MADCGKYHDMISALIDGELTDNEIGDLNEHARNCRSCAELIKLYSAMSSAMSDIEKTPPNNLSHNIMGQIRYDSKKNKKKRSLRRLTAVAAVLVVVISGLFILRQAFPFSDSSNTSSAEDSAVIEAETDNISPEEFTERTEAAPASGAAETSTYYSSSPADAETSEEEPEQPTPEETGETVDILEEDSSTIEVLFTDAGGNEITILAEANLLDELLNFSGVYSETVTGEPIYKIKYTLDSVEQMYSIWVSNESVLVQSADGVLNISAISLESFENFLP